MRLKPFIKNEDYDKEYGILDYRGKIILDLGADYGSTAEFFLERGARKVIAIEGNKGRYDGLVNNSKWMKNIIPIFVFLNNPKQFSELINKYKPDIIKSDLDGGEIHLFGIPDAVFSSVNEYTMEIHSMKILKLCLEKIFRNGYHIIEFKKLGRVKVGMGIFRDGVLITFIKPNNSKQYFASMRNLFEFWGLYRKTMMLTFKILTIGDEFLLLEFLRWLTPEALDLWFHYGKEFNLSKVKEILTDYDSLKVAGMGRDGLKMRIIVFGHLYNFTKETCRLGVVAGIVSKGYGTKMMETLISFAKSLHVKRIYLSTYQDNLHALALYRRFGFKIVKKYSDRPRKRYEMELILK